MLIGDSEISVINTVSSANGTLFTGHAARAVARRLHTEEGASASVRNNFIVDSSTPHGDAIIVDRSVMKPALGWVTAHTTEGLRSGLHEWCIKIEHQGETSDGSGLMLGIVPKNFSRYDSFISQGGGWCLSRAGKFYGHWRRVDNNTSVSTLTFGTGDKVIFELDLDNLRMTVRVGEKYVTGELSNVAGEVFPAVSLHYRHQHVRFDYHKVHERGQRRKAWVDRGCFPSSACFLPVESLQDASILPLPHYLFSPELSDACNDKEANIGEGQQFGFGGMFGGRDAAGVDGASPRSPTGVSTGTASLPSASSYALESYSMKLLLVARAVGVFQRLLAAGPALLLTDGSQLVRTPVSELRHAARQHVAVGAVQTLLRALLPTGFANSGVAPHTAMLAGGGVGGFGGGFSSSLFGVSSTFAGDCGALLMLQAVSQPSAATAIVLGALPMIIQFLAKGEPFSLSEAVPEGGSSISADMAQNIADRIYALLTPSLTSVDVPRDARTRILELLVVLAVQRGSVSDAVRAVRLLLSMGDEYPEARLSDQTSRWLRSVCAALRPPRILFPFGAARLSGRGDDMAQRGDGSSGPSTSSNSGPSEIGPGDEDEEVLVLPMTALNSKDNDKAQKGDGGAGAVPAVTSTADEEIYSYAIDSAYNTPSQREAASLSKESSADASQSTQPMLTLFVHTTSGIKCWPGGFPNSNSTSATALSSPARSPSTSGDLRANPKLVAVSVREIGEVWQETMAAAAASSPIPSVISGLKWAQKSSMCVDEEYLYWCPTTLAPLSALEQEEEERKKKQNKAITQKGVVVEEDGAFPLNRLVIIVFKKKTLRPAFVFTGDHPLISKSLTATATDSSKVASTKGNAADHQAVSASSSPNEAAVAATFSWRTRVMSLPPPRCIENVHASAAAQHGMSRNSSYEKVKPSLPSGGFLIAYQSSPHTNVKMVSVSSPSTLLLPPSAGVPTSAAKIPSAPLNLNLNLSPTLPRPAHHHAIALNLSTRIGLISTALKSRAMSEDEQLGTSASLLPPSAASFTIPRGYVCIEMWFKLGGRCEPQTLLRSGDKAQQGELFVDFAVTEGAFCVRGGYRHDTRGAHIVTIPMPISAATNAYFHHIALCYDGRWRLVLDGVHEVYARGTASQQPALEAIFASFTLGGTFTGLVSDLRVWRGARTSADIARDCCVAMSGDEPNLCLYWPMGEAEGSVLYDHSPNRFHGILRRSDVPSGSRFFAGGGAATSSVFNATLLSSSFSAATQSNGGRGLAGGVAASASPLFAANSTASIVASSPTRVYLSRPCVSSSIFASNHSSSAKDQRLCPDLDSASLVWDAERSLLLVSVGEVVTAHQLLVLQEGRTHGQAEAAAASSSSTQPSFSLSDLHLTYLLESKGSAPSEGDTKAPVAKANNGDISLLMCTPTCLYVIVPPSPDAKTVSEDEKEKSEAQLGDSPGGLARAPFAFRLTPMSLQSPSEAVLRSCPDWVGDTANTNNTPFTLPTTAFVLMLLMEYCAERLGIYSNPSGSGLSGEGGAAPPAFLHARLFLPFVADVSIDCLWSLIALIRDHFRQMQVRSAPKTHNLRHDTLSAPVLAVALRLLDQQIRVAGIYRIHPAMLELEIPEEAVGGASASGPSPSDSIGGGYDGIHAATSSSMLIMSPVRPTAGSSSRLLSGNVHHSPSLQRRMKQTFTALDRVGDEEIYGEEVEGGDRGTACSERVDNEPANTSRSLFRAVPSDKQVHTVSNPPRLGHFILNTLADLVQASETLGIPESIIQLATALIGRCIPHHFALPARRAALLLGLLLQKPLSLSSPTTPLPQQATSTVHLAGGATLTSTRKPPAPVTGQSPPHPSPSSVSESNTSKALQADVGSGSNTHLPNYTALVIGLVEALANVESCLALAVSPCPPSLAAASCRTGESVASSSLLEAVVSHLLDESSKTTLHLMKGLYDEEDNEPTATITSPSSRIRGGVGKSSCKMFAERFVRSASKALGTMQLVMLAKTVRKLPQITFSNAAESVAAAKSNIGESKAPSPSSSLGSMSRALVGQVIFSSSQWGGNRPSTMGGTVASTKPSLSQARLEHFASAIVSQSTGVLEAFIEEIHSKGVAAVPPKAAATTPSPSSSATTALAGHRRNARMLRVFTVLPSSAVLGLLQVAILAAPLHATPHSSVATLSRLQSLSTLLKHCRDTTKEMVSSFVSTSSEQTLTHPSGKATEKGQSSATSSSLPRAAGECLSLFVELLSTLRGSLASLASTMATAPIPILPKALRHTAVLLLDNNKISPAELSPLFLKQSRHADHSGDHPSSAAVLDGNSIVGIKANLDARLPKRWRAALANASEWRDSTSAEARVGDEAFQLAINLVACAALHLSKRNFSTHPPNTLSTHVHITKGRSGGGVCTSLAFGDEHLPAPTNDELKKALVAVRPIRRMLLSHRENAAVVGHAIATAAALLELSSPYSAAQDTAQDIVPVTSTATQKELAWKDNPPYSPSTGWSSTHCLRIVLSRSSAWPSAQYIPSSTISSVSPKQAEAKGSEDLAVMEVDATLSPPQPPARTLSPVSSSNNNQNIKGNLSPTVGLSPNSRAGGSGVFGNASGGGTTAKAKWARSLRLYRIAKLLGDLHASNEKRSMWETVDQVLVPLFNPADANSITAAALYRQQEGPPEVNGGGKKDSSLLPSSDETPQAFQSIPHIVAEQLASCRRYSTMRAFGFEYFASLLPPGGAPADELAMALTILATALDRQLGSVHNKTTLESSGQLQTPGGSSPNADTHGAEGSFFYHYSTGMVGAADVCRAQRAFYALLRYSTADTGLRHLTPVFIKCALRPNDFALFASLRLSKRLIDEISLFAADSGLLKDETAVEKTHRIAVHERYKHVANGLSPPPITEESKLDPRSLKEEERARSWRLLATLGASSAEAAGADPTAFLASHTHFATRMFLDDFFAAISGELDKCAEYCKSYYYPSQERVAEHVATLCNLVSVTAKLLPESGRHCRQAIVCAAQLVGIAVTPMLPAYPPYLPDTCVRSAGDVLLKSSPSQCQQYFAAISPSLSVPETVANNGDAVITVLVGIALKSQCGAEGYMNGPSGAAIGVLCQLARTEAWGSSVDQLTATLSPNMRVAASLELSEACRREHLLAVLVTCIAIGGFPSVTLTAGAEVLVPQKGTTPTTASGSPLSMPVPSAPPTHFVRARIVEVNYLNNAVTTVQLPLSEGHPEVETQMHHVRSPFSIAMATSSVDATKAPSPFLGTFAEETRGLTARRAEMLDAALLTLTLEWSAVSSSPCGAAAAAALLRLATIVAVKDPFSVIRWARRGVLRRINEAVATKSVLVPTPFAFLDELSSVYLAAIFRPVRSSLSSQALAGSNALHLALAGGSSIGGGFSVGSGANDIAGELSGPAVPRAALQRVTQQMLVPTSEPPVPAALASLTSSTKRFLPSYKSQRAREPANVLLFAHPTHAAVVLTCDPDVNGDRPLKCFYDSRGGGRRGSEDAMARPYPSLPPITSGLTIELTLMLSDCGSHMLLSAGPNSAPKCVSRVSFEHRILSLIAPPGGNSLLKGKVAGQTMNEKERTCGTRMLSLELRGKTVYFGIPREATEGPTDEVSTLRPSDPPKGTFAYAPLSTRDFDRWIHLVALITPQDLVLFRDGEPVAGVPHGMRDVLQAIQGCVAIVGSRDEAAIAKEAEDSGDTDGAEASETVIPNAHFPPSSVTDGLFMVGGLRLWGYALQAQLLQSINDVFRGDAGLPHVSLADSQCISFRFEEGIVISGTLVISDNGEHFGHLSGVVRWAPQKDIFQLPDNFQSAIPTDFSEMESPAKADWCSVGVGGDLGSLMEIPRRDVAAYLESLEPTSAATYVLHNMLSLAVHYARRCLTHALCSTSSLALRVALVKSGECRDADREAVSLFTAVVPLHDMVPTIANLLRYSETDAVHDVGALRTLSAMVSRVMRQESASIPADLMADVMRKQFTAAAQILREDCEEFSVELLYCSAAFGDAVAPLLVMNGGMRSFNTDEGRHMDSMTLYSDKLNRHIFARAPDSSSFWSEHVAFTDRWLYAKPQCAVKYSSAFFTVKARTVRHQIAATLLASIINEASAIALGLSPSVPCLFSAGTAPHVVAASQQQQAIKWLDTVFNQQFIRALTHQFETSRSPSAHHQSLSPPTTFGTRRPEVLEALTAIYRAWRLFPQRNRFDQSPIRMSIDRVVAVVHSSLRRAAIDATSGGLFGVLSPILGAHAAHIQVGASLVVAAIECQEAWRTSSLLNATRRQRKSGVGESDDDDEAHASRCSSLAAAFFENDCAALLRLLNEYYAEATTMPSFDGRESEVVAESNSGRYTNLKTASEGGCCLPFPSVPQRTSIAAALQRLPQTAPPPFTRGLNATASTTVVTVDALFPSLVKATPQPSASALVYLNPNPCRRKGSGVLTSFSDRPATLRSTVGIKARRGGRFYWEIRLSDSLPAPPSVGIVTEDFKGSGSDGAMGHCYYSWCFDGARQCRSHRGVREDFSIKPKWKSGDVISLKLDMEGDGMLSCLLNNKVISKFEGFGLSAGTIVYPAVYLTRDFLALEVNFGAAPFAFELPLGFSPLDMSGYFLKHNTVFPMCVAMARYGQAIGSAIDSAATFVQGDGDVGKENTSVLNIFGRRSAMRRMPKIELPMLLDEKETEHSSASGRKGPPTVRFYPNDSRGSFAVSDEISLVGAPLPQLFRGNCVITSGRWYYELSIEVEGPVCVGWAARTFFDNIKKTTSATSRVSVGDDPFSWVLDGSAMALRHNKTQRNLGRQRWRAGDVVGVLLDCEKGTISFSVNGQPLRDLHDVMGKSTNLSVPPSAFATTRADLDSAAASDNSNPSLLASSALLGGGLVPIVYGNGGAVLMRTHSSAMEFFPFAASDSTSASAAPPTPTMPLGYEEYATRMVSAFFNLKSTVSDDEKKKSEKALKEQSPRPSYTPPIARRVQVDIAAALRAREALLDVTEAATLHAILDLPTSTASDPIYNDCFLGPLRDGRTHENTVVVSKRPERKRANNNDNDTESRTDTEAQGKGPEEIGREEKKGLLLERSTPAVPERILLFACESYQFVLRSLFGPLPPSSASCVLCASPLGSALYRFAVAQAQHHPLPSLFSVRSSVSTTMSTTTSLLPLFAAARGLGRLSLPANSMIPFKTILAATEEPLSVADANVKLTLNRRNALATRASRDEGRRFRCSIFGQLLAALVDKGPSFYSRSGRLWSVVFAGEGADDVGGPYRECLSAVCEELMGGGGSAVLPFFVPTPNNAHNVGEARDKLTVSPIVDTVRVRSQRSLFTQRDNQKKTTGAERLAERFSNSAAFGFLGRLIGGCLRTGEPLALFLPSSVWRFLSSAAPLSAPQFPTSLAADGPDDDGEIVETEDIGYGETLKYLVELASRRSKDGIGRDFEDGDEDVEINDEISEVLGEGFTTYDVLGRAVDLLPSFDGVMPLLSNEEGSGANGARKGGRAPSSSSKIAVTKRLLPFYIDLFRSHRLFFEGIEAKTALARGFFSVIPRHALAASASLGWQELELMVCGQPDFDVDVLMGNAKFENISPSDPRVRYLSNILKAFSPRQRSMFARFVSGRERLPPTLHLKIMHNSHADGPEDTHLPTASTCFYWISLPHFSSQEVMEEKLLFAITQCLDIDADFVMRGGAAIGGLDREGGPAGGASASQAIAPPRGGGAMASAGAGSFLAQINGGGGGSAMGIDDDEFEDYSHLL